MKLNHGLHLAYCTNVHRGRDWRETFESLQTHTLAVRQRVSPDAPYAIGLRLGHQAARELAEPEILKAFKRWLDANQCYVFTINGFPYGRFHGERVKEQVYQPDWTSPERLAYTNRLVELIDWLVPQGMEGSISTVPGSFKEFIHTPAQARAIRDNLWHSIEFIARVKEQTGRSIHLDLEPEPLGLLETSEETSRFFERMRADHPNDPRLDEHLRVNYDACHLAVEFEEPQDAVARFKYHGIKIGKIHLSSALTVEPTPDARRRLSAFADDIYLHQVVVRGADGSLVIYRDLDQALAAAEAPGADPGQEWRVHFHVPLHSPPSDWYGTTTPHLLGLLDQLQADPSLCSHLEMETYTWEVLPPELKNRSVVDQLVAEYDWTLRELGARGLASTRPSRPPHG